AGLKKVEQDLKKRRVEEPRITTILTSLLLPAGGKIVWARARLHRQNPALRIVGAVRLHAAAPHGEVAATLTDLAVPIPLDPATGKAFGYELKAGKAYLLAPPRAGEAPQPRANTIRYEISLRTKQ